MSKNRFATIFMLLILALGEYSCTATTLTPEPGPSPLVYATLPIDPTITPTPFQPTGDLVDPGIYSFPTSSNASIPTLQLSITATALPSNAAGMEATSTPFQPAFEFPTVDLTAILPTTLSPPVIDGAYGAPAALPVMTDNETITFALLGSDSRGGTYFRTDTIILAAVRPRTGQVTMISVPRDLWVYIPQHGMDRVNTAYEYGEILNYPGGGPGLLKDTILYNLGMRIDHTALVDFNGFRMIVDTLGGIDVPVYCPYTDWRLIAPDLDPENEDNWALYTVEPGLIHMDGDLALWYARSRKKSSDFDRGRRSQEVIRALYNRGMQIDALTKIPELYSDLSSNVSTDLTLADILALAPMALHLNNADIRSYYIGREHITSWVTPLGAAVLLPNPVAIQGLMQEALSASEIEAEVPVQVEVRNGTNNPAWDLLAAERLNYAGYGTRTAPADRKDYAQTLLYDVSTIQDPIKAASLLAILGLQPSALVSAPMNSDVPYILIIGHDYQPCFNPANLAP